MSNEPEFDNNDLELEGAAAEAPAPKQSGSDLFDWAQALVTAIICIILLFTFVGRVIGVIGSSMIDTLHNGDRVILQTIGYTPEVGDIVVLTKESFSTEPIVKRVIATEGQTVDIDFEAGVVTVDGEVRDEPFIYEPTYTQGDMEFPLTVDEGCIFVMGDNRNGSTDSRFSRVGQVDERCVLGKVILRIFPFSAIGTVD